MAGRAACRQVRWYDLREEPDALTRTSGSVRGARGSSQGPNPSPYRDVDQLQDDYPKLMEAIESARYAHSDGMGAYLCFMAVRLLEMHRVLKPTGSIYLHCDPTASHYLKAAMDAIFGWKNFRNEIIWHYRRWTGNAKKFQQLHDIILFYTKAKTYTFNILRIEYTEGSKKRKEQGVLHRFKQGHQPVLVSNKSVSKKGVPENDVWQIPFIAPSAKERLGYPTQKPIRLYSRIIEASSNEGDIVLDPFAGCATTLVAAEILKRHWIGIDIWEGARKLVTQRLRDTTGVFGEVNYTKELPERTDDKQEAVPFLQVKYQAAKEPPGQRMTRAEIYDVLLSQQGIKCQGCDRVFDDPRYLQLDHNTPRSDGGINHISNRILLCGPCNQLKSNIYTLSGLRRENKKRGYMAAPLYGSTS